MTEAQRKRRMKRHSDNFFCCPGSMMGNMPHSKYLPDATWGNITINVPDLMEALAFLKRRYNITATRASEHHDAIIIDIETKSQ